MDALKEIEMSMTPLLIIDDWNTKKINEPKRCLILTWVMRTISSQLFRLIRSFCLNRLPYSFAIRLATWSHIGSIKHGFHLQKQWVLLQSKSHARHLNVHIICSNSKWMHYTNTKHSHTHAHTYPIIFGISSRRSGHLFTYMNTFYGFTEPCLNQHW